MSWDVVIVNARDLPTNLEGPPDEFESEPLGSPEEVRQLISSALPGIDWSDPSWGLFEGDGFSIEFSIGEDDPVSDAMLHVRGNGDPLPSIVRVCKQSGWAAYDTSDGATIDLDNPSRAGWEAFVGFREKVIAQARDGALDAVPATDSDEEVGLPGCDLWIVDGSLVESDGKKVFANHPLSGMRNLRFGAGTRVFSVVFVVVAAALAAAAKMFIPFGWLSWPLTVILGLVAFIFLRSVRGEMVWFLERGQEKSYALIGSSEEVEAFRSALKRAWREASQMR